MKNQDLLNTFKSIHDFCEKFPLIRFDQVDWVSLSKHYSLNQKFMVSCFVFMDAIRKTNTVIDVSEIKQMRVKRKEKEWNFILYLKKTSAPIKIIHLVD